MYSLQFLNFFAILNFPMNKLHKTSQKRSFPWISSFWNLSTQYKELIDFPPQKVQKIKAS